MSQGYLSLDDTSRAATQVNFTYAKDEAPTVTDVMWPQILDELRAQSELQDTVLFDSSAVRLHVLITNPPDLPGSLRLARTNIPVPSEILSLVAKSLEDYEALWENDAGSSSILDTPRRFLMQTPNDGDSFCSLVIRTNWVSSSNNMLSSVGTTKYSPFNIILITSEPKSHLSKIAQSFTVPSVWNSTDLPMVVIPLEFLIKHVRQVSKTLADLTSEISRVEDVVINDNDTMDFKSLIKKLHLCSRDLVKLRRRWHFQITLGETIQELIGNPLQKSSEHGQLLSAASLQLKLIQSLKYDLDVLPERISNQFDAIFNLMAQRDTQASMSVAESSRKDNLYMQEIADATLRDSSSMKTIAVLTMVFLPGTFICSFFSMTMFNWNNQPNEPLVSPYIWVYFVAMVPLTLVVLTVWWWKTRESRREQEENKKRRTLARGNSWGGASRPKRDAF